MTFLFLIFIDKLLRKYLYFIKNKDFNFNKK